MTLHKLVEKKSISHLYCITLIEFLVDTGVGTKAAIKRMIKQGGVRIGDGVAKNGLEPVFNNDVVRYGKLRYMRCVLEDVPQMWAEIYETNVVT